MTESSPLTRYVVPLVRWWPILLVTLGLGLLLAWFTLPDGEAGDAEVVEDPEVAYRATEILLRGRQTPVTANFELVLLLARQGEVANAVAARLGDRLDMADIEAVELIPDEQLGTLSVTATRPLPDQAVELAEIFSQELVRYFDGRADTSTEERTQQATLRLTVIDDRIRTLEEEVELLPEEDLDRRLLESEIEVLIGQYGALQAEVRDLSTQDLGAGSTFETLQAPVAVSTDSDDMLQVLQVPENSIARFVLAALAALAVGVAIVLAVDWADTRVRTRQDAEQWFGLPVVAELPYRSRRQRSEHPLPAQTEPSSMTAEALRTLRLAVEQSPVWRLDHTAPIGNGSVGSATTVANGPRRTILVSSSLTGEGKTTVAANLAATYAASGRTVLVIDCDFRRPSLSGLMGVEHGRGLHELSFLSPETLDGLRCATAIPGVELIRSGRPGIAPPWFLSDASPLVAWAREQADVVILDAGPMLATNETAALMPFVDVTLLVSRSGRVSRDQARRTTEQLTRLSAHVAGIVLVGEHGSHRYGYYGAAYEVVDADQGPRGGRKRRGAPDRRGAHADHWRIGGHPGPRQTPADASGTWTAAEPKG
jgi:capsular exopolysaccharide synthesis family protein